VVVVVVEEDEKDLIDSLTDMTAAERDEMAEKNEDKEKEQEKEKEQTDTGVVVDVRQDILKPLHGLPL
jgi:hypothetical protein